MPAPERFASHVPRNPANASVPEEITVNSFAPSTRKCLPAMLAAAPLAVSAQGAPLGEVVVVSVQPGYSIAQMAAPFQTKRGDLVKPAAR